MDQIVKIAHGEKRKVPFPLQMTFLPLKQSMIHPIAMSLLPNKSELLAYKRITNSSSNSHQSIAKSCFLISFFQIKKHDELLKNLQFIKSVKIMKFFGVKHVA